MTSAGGPTMPPAEPTYPGEAAPYPGEPVYEVARPDRITRFFDRIATRSPRWLAPIAVLACFGGAVGYTLYADPTRSAPDAAPTCLLKLTTGLDCPGCGGTRAFWYLLHGDLPAAARHHILFVFAVPFVVYLYLAWASKQLFGWRLPRLTVGPMTIGIFLGAWMAFSVLRNLPWAPFTWFYV
ncbi:DUF2752 domain-containing protein [Micromonospora sp. NPDC050417]|uniref:DUF2752 domain-containing protein n=1 Tax=Micromonospora sp. NPDC050417 TaxID=3364280 RepID=UPI0037955366